MGRSTNEDAEEVCETSTIEWILPKSKTSQIHLLRDEKDAKRQEKNTPL